MSDASMYQHELIVANLLGYATDDQIAEYLALLDRDPAFRVLSADLEKFLLPIREKGGAVQPPDGVLEQIMASISDGETASGEPVELETSRVSVDRPARPDRIWQYATAASVLVAVLATGANFVPRASLPLASPERLVAVMSGAEAPELVLLSYDRTSGVISARLFETSLPTGGVWQLWLLRDEEAAPMSLGLLTATGEDGDVKLDIAKGVALDTDTFAVSLEPPGGSPADGPTGPVIFTGKASPI